MAWNQIGVCISGWFVIILTINGVKACIDDSWDTQHSIFCATILPFQSVFWTSGKWIKRENQHLQQKSKNEKKVFSNNGYDDHFLFIEYHWPIR